MLFRSLIPSDESFIDLDVMTKTMEALGKANEDMGFCLSLAAHAFGCAFPVHLAGSSIQKNSTLSALKRGSLLGAGAITEDMSGSDAFAMQTTAVREDEFYMLEGEKRFVTNGPTADLFLIYARTSPGNSPLSVSAFLVKRDCPGLEIQPEPEKIGARSAGWARLRLHGCRVSARARVGAEGVGGALFLEAMKWERMALSAAQVGAMQASLDRCVQFAKSRVRFGVPLSKFQALSHQIVDMQIRLETARALLGSVARDLQAGALLEDRVAMVKLAVSEAAFQNGYSEARSEERRVGKEC